jgi:hypothetical protein
MRDRPHASRADVDKNDRKFADQHPTPDDHSPDIVKPGTGAQATEQVTRGSFPGGDGYDASRALLLRSGRSIESLRRHGMGRQ